MVKIPSISAKQTTTSHFIPPHTMEHKKVKKSSSWIETDTKIWRR